MLGSAAFRSQVDDQSFLLADKVREPGKDLIGSTQLFMKLMRCHAWQRPYDGVSSKKSRSETETAAHGFRMVSIAASSEVSS
jgi:hypothetical protein